MEVQPPAPTPATLHWGRKQSSTAKCLWWCKLEDGAALAAFFHQLQLWFQADPTQQEGERVPLMLQHFSFPSLLLEHTYFPVKQSLQAAGREGSDFKATVKPVSGLE